MTIHQLFQSIGVTADCEQQAQGITADSRQVKPGYVFVAVNGVNVDGHAYIAKAIEAGAIAVVCEHVPADIADVANVTWGQVPDSAQALGLLADCWYGKPSSKLTLVGVTGTNGKTTIATLLYDMARLFGEKAGLLSTVANKIDDTVIEATHTTPDPITIHRLLAEMVDAGCTFCSMEVSSHACDQQRIAGLRFDGGIFTNLTRDHLDYHKTFANYLTAKKKFFDSLPAEAFALTNIDDKNGRVMLQNCKARQATYSLRGNADFNCRVVEDRLDGMLITLDGTEVETRFTGRYNASNLTAVYGASLLLGRNRADVLRAISQLTPVDGRMQTIRTRRGVIAIIDYAHTPDALANTLDAIADTLKGTTARIITVAGAGGDRDAGKRPLMAAEAAKASDWVIITSDNPRSEDPAEIARQMVEGIPADKRDSYEVILDRAQAISHALEMAAPGDAVLIAGKGHEDYQIIGTEKRHFSDREEVLKQA